MMEFLSDRVDNIVGKGANVGLAALSPFPTMFQMALYSVASKEVRLW